LESREMVAGRATARRHRAMEAMIGDMVLFG